jgi:hypothetical protein
VGDHSGPKQYTSASNHEVTALGSASPVICFEDWQVNKVEAVVLSPLKRPLFSTSRMVAAGWRIVHDSEERERRIICLASGKWKKVEDDRHGWRLQDARLG